MFFLSFSFCLFAVCFSFFISTVTRPIRRVNPRHILLLITLYLTTITLPRNPLSQVSLTLHPPISIPSHHKWDNNRLPLIFLSRVVILLLTNTHSHRMPDPHRLLLISPNKVFILLDLTPIYPNFSISLLSMILIDVTPIY